jgi:hypothetical protein
MYHWIGEMFIIPGCYNLQKNRHVNTIDMKSVHWYLGELSRVLKCMDSIDTWHEMKI